MVGVEDLEGSSNSKLCESATKDLLKVISSSTHSSQKKIMANTLGRLLLWSLRYNTQGESIMLVMLRSHALCPGDQRAGKGKVWIFHLSWWETEFCISTQWAILPQYKWGLEAREPKSLAMDITRIGIKWKDLWYLLKCQLRRKKLFLYHLWSAFSG